jgi:hypothetical protein
LIGHRGISQVEAAKILDSGTSDVWGDGLRFQSEADFVDFAATPVYDTEFLVDGKRLDGGWGGGFALKGSEHTAGGEGVGLLAEVVQLGGRVGPVAVLC